MIAFSHYGTADDVSGVTSWLRRLLAWLARNDVATSLRIHDFGRHPEAGELLRDSNRMGIAASGVRMPVTSGKAVVDILRFLNDSRPRVFLPQGLPGPHFAAAIAAEAGLPWVLSLHSDDPWYWGLLESCGPAASDGVCVAVSEAIAEEASRLRPDADVRIIPYGVDVPEDRAAWNERRFLIVYSGRLVEEQKCISRVLDTLLAACGLSERIEAVFIGDGAERATLEKRVAEAGMENRIRFRGRVPSDEVQQELLQANAILLMSDYEGLPVALLEGMACGLVPMARGIRSGIPQIVKPSETGLILADEPAQAAAAIARLADDPQAWGSMSERARQLVDEKYSNEVCCRRWGALLEELGSRCNAEFPLKIPFKPRLPGFDPRLAEFDVREHKWWKPVLQKGARAIKRLR